MNESINNWRKQELIQKYFDQIVTQYNAQNLSKDLLHVVDFENKYAFIFKTADILNNKDVEYFQQYIVETLKDEGYITNKVEKDSIALQASVDRRVSGIQLFGNIKVVKLQDELQIIVSPYNDRQYEPQFGKDELISELFK